MPIVALLSSAGHEERSLAPPRLKIPVSISSNHIPALRELNRRDQAHFRCPAADPAFAAGTGDQSDHENRRLDLSRHLSPGGAEGAYTDKQQWSVQQRCTVDNTLVPQLTSVRLVVIPLNDFPKWTASYRKSVVWERSAV